MSGYIIDNWHVCEQARLCRSVCNSALENVCIIINSAYIRTSIDSYFYLSLWLWMSVPVSGYVITDCMCINISWSCLFLSFSLEICSSVLLSCHWLYVHRYVSWSAFLSLFLSISVSPYIFGNCTCIRTSLGSYFFLCLCLWMCTVVSGYFITHCRFICTSWSVFVCLFLSEFFSACSAML